MSCTLLYFCILGIHGCYLTKKEPNLLKERLFLIHFFVHLWASMLQRTVQMRISPYNLFLPTLIMCLAFLMITLLQVY